MLGLRPHVVAKSINQQVPFFLKLLDQDRPLALAAFFLLPAEAADRTSSDLGAVLDLCAVLLKERHQVLVSEISAHLVQVIKAFDRLHGRLLLNDISRPGALCV